jgi:hypothetical protein
MIYKALFASYQVSYRIAQNKKLQMITETVIFPAVIDIIQTMFGKKMSQQLSNVPISNYVVSRRIADISEDSEEELIEKVRNKRFAIHTD